MVIYLARGMSNRPRKLVYKEALRDRTMLRFHGITPNCPVEKEQVSNTTGTLMASKTQMDKFWSADKKLIREAHVLFDMTPDLKSEGVAHELGYARYFLFKPIVRVYSEGKMPAASSIAFYEADLVVDSLEEAIKIAKQRWGTLFKRFNWRIKMYRKSLLKAIFHKLGEWK